MNSPKPTEEEIFRVAHEITIPEARMAYLKQVCRDANEVERIVELLRAGAEEQSFLENGPAGVQATEMHHSLSEAPGELIGPYKLLQQIGEGGFGVVYMAEQTEPVRRKVALKVIKPGMDTKEVIARFEAERQALALMDHPNIARVFDGGTTSSGRPFFVMELVKGIPLTKFCDENKFDLRKRLELFFTVCKAIQHAHHKGVIHRDIKPSNVLVTLHDGVPVPKVIDFGVSKAISQQLTEKTMFTAHGQMIGTPQYMSPEQAEMSGLDIDTRSDIYSLGILLYELMTGQTPLDPKKIRSTAYFELQRMIREDEPQAPSFQFSKHSEQSTLAATLRKSSPQKLGTLIKGELDWIVMKSLDKDRNRRYDSANAMATDVEAYLNNETVEACPPTLKYRFQKYARKHKSFLVTYGSFTLILMIATIVSLLSMFDANKARQQAEGTLGELEITLKELGETVQALKKEKNYTQQSALNKAVAAATIGNIEQAKQAVSEAELIDAEPWLKMIDGQEAFFNGESEKGVLLLEEAFALAPNDIILQGLLADAYLTSGKWEDFTRLDISKGNVEAITDFEKIFVGNALLWTATEKSLDLLNEAVDGTQHPLAYIYRARTGAFVANAKRDISLMEQSVRDAELGATLLPDNSLAHTHQLTALLLATDLYSNKLEGKESLAQQAMARAKISAEKLQEFKNSSDAGLLVGLYFQSAGDEKRAVENFKRSGHGKAPLIEYAFDLQRTEKEVDELIEILAKEPFGYGRSNLYQCVLLLDRGKTDEANQLIDEYILKGKNEKLGWVIDFALLVGREKDAKEVADIMLEDFQPEDIGVRADYIRFNTEEMTEENINAYLGTPPLVSHGGKNFHVGLRYLAAGDRQKALKYFERCIEQGLVVESSQFYAQALSERINEDPTWPNWIKENGS